MSPGTLFLVATPIGNLEDITLRALRTLREVDLIAAEDTRRTRKLLAAHGIHTPLVSYHEHNAKMRGPKLVQTLLAGKSVALVTDAGTPSVADPGFDLVRLVTARGIAVTVIPGPSAVTTALIASGLPVYPFLFLGFPPSQPAARRTFLARYARAPETLVLFESPRRVGACLRDIRRIWGNRRAAVARELTKLHEELFRGTLDEAVERWPGATRGEITLVVAGAPEEERDADDSLLEQVRLRLESDPRPLKEIAAEIAEQRGLGKRLVYQLALKIKGGFEGR
jgi:16S rRNA (cytidine1402-2'-O)-methyltransferase